MNTFDLIILAFLAIGTAIGLYRGFFKELVGTVGLFLAAIVANIVSPYAKSWLGDWITDQLVASVILWVVTFLLMLFIMNRVAWLLDKIFKSLNIGWVNRLFGGLFAFVKFALIAALVVSALEFAAGHVDGLKFTESMHQSHIIPILHRLVHVVMPWFADNVISPALDMIKG